MTAQRDRGAWRNPQYSKLNPLPEGYRPGDVVHRSGIFWQSAVDNNLSMPGVDTNWTALVPAPYADAGWFKVAETVLSSSATSIDFQNIPATYRTLKIIASLRSDGAVNTDAVATTLNNDTTDANYDRMSLQGAGATPTAFENLTASNPRRLILATGSTSPTNDFSPSELTIIDYASTSKLKIVQAMMTHWGSRTSGQLILRHSFLGWASTAAVNRITFAPTTGTNFVSGSAVSIYGIKAAA